MFKYILARRSRVIGFVTLFSVALTLVIAFQNCSAGFGLNELTTNLALQTDLEPILRSPEELGAPIVSLVRISGSTELGLIEGTVSYEVLGGPGKLAALILDKDKKTVASLLGTVNTPRDGSAAVLGSLTRIDAAAVNFTGSLVEYSLTIRVGGTDYTIPVSAPPMMISATLKGSSSGCDGTLSVAVSIDGSMTGQVVDSLGRVICLATGGKYNFDNETFTGLILTNPGPPERIDMAFGSVTAIASEYVVTIRTESGGSGTGGGANSIGGVSPINPSGAFECGDAHNGSFASGYTKDEGGTAIIVGADAAQEKFKFCKNGEPAQRLRDGRVFINNVSGPGLIWDCGTPDNQCGAQLGAAVCGSKSIESGNITASRLPPSESDHFSCRAGAKLVTNPAPVLTLEPTKTPLCTPKSKFDDNTCPAGLQECSYNTENNTSVPGCGGELSTGVYAWTCQLIGAPGSTTCRGHYSDAGSEYETCADNVTRTLGEATVENTNFKIIVDNGICHTRFAPKDFNPSAPTSMAVAIDFVRQLLDQTDNTVVTGTGNCREKCGGGTLGRVACRAGVGNKNRECDKDHLGPRPMVDEDNHETPDYFCKSMSSGQWGISPLPISVFSVVACSDPAIADKASTHGPLLKPSAGGLRCNPYLSWPPYPDMDNTVTPPKQKENPDGSLAFVSKDGQRPPFKNCIMTEEFESSPRCTDVYNYPDLAESNGDMVQRLDQLTGKPQFIPVPGEKKTPENRFVNALTCKVQ